MYSTIFHMDLVDGLIILVEGSRVQKFDSVEVRHHCNHFVLFPVLSQQLLYLTSTLPHVRRHLSQFLTTHKFTHLLDCLSVNSSFEVSLFQELEILLLILVRIVFYEPKLSLGFHSRKVKLRELLLLYLDAPADFRAMLERLA